MNQNQKTPTVPAPSPADATETKGSQSPALVVAIGVSPGGGKSLQRFFARQPAGLGVAYVLIQSADFAQNHPAPTELPAHTPLAVVTAADGMPLLTDRIHVVPSDKSLSISGDRLTFRDPITCNGLHMPIDHFFCSLAIDRQQCSYGVLLGNTASDGMLGLSEIRAGGGRTFVEAPNGTDVIGLPSWTRDPVLVEALLPPETIADAIVKTAGQINTENRKDTTRSAGIDADLRAVLELVRSRIGHDFRCYKPNTLVRRIQRRMSLHKVDTFGGYLRFLHEQPEEVQLLRKDLLIGVTEFFRQPQAWAFLDNEVIGELVAGAQRGKAIRAWVPGCSTGQEAYSLAMLLAEQQERSGEKLLMQIFATDPDDTSLTIARSGVYTEEQLGPNVSAERRERFFTRQDNGWRIRKELREGIVFAPQNLTTDPPFSRMDLITCRNLLIYLDQQVQQKILALFHFALREGGFLFLGTAETVGSQQDLFAPVSKKWRIYRRIGMNRRVGTEIPLRQGSTPLTVAQQRPVSSGSPRMSLATVAQQALLDRFAPACVMIDRKHNILYVHGPVENYLTFPAGELSTRIVDMARKGLGARLRGAIDQCIDGNRPVSATARVQRGNKSVPVKASVSPLQYPPQADGLLLITFEDRRATPSGSRRTSSEKSDLQVLEDELKITREELESAIQQLENSNDQLKASNEEFTAANEELQATNEELETSKEELHSLNEELNTINNRLQEKVEELEGTNNDVVNLLSSTNIATLFLDKELRIRRYTPAITHLFSLIPSDLGRPFADVLRRFKDQALMEDAHQVLADLSTLRAEVQADDGRWYIRRITPYRTQDDRIDGVVVTFGEVTDLKRSEQRNRFLANLLERSSQPFGISYPDGRFGMINGALERLIGYNREELTAMGPAESLTPPEWRPTEKAQLQELLRTGQPVRYEKEFLRKDGTRIAVELLVHLMTDDQGWPVHYYSFITDLSERKQAEAALRRQAALIDLSPDGIIVRQTDGTITFWNLGAETLYGWSREEAIGDKTHALLQTQFPQPLEEIVRHIRQYGRWSGEFKQRTKDGREIIVQSFWVARFDGQGNVTELLESNLDVTERKLAEQAARDSEARFRLLSETAGRLLAAPEPLGIVNELCRQVMAYLDCQAFFNFLLDEQTGKLHLNAYAGIPREEAQKIAWLDGSNSVCGCVAADKIPIIVNDIATTPDLRTELVKSYGIQAYACHPLLAGNRLLGTLSFGTKTRTSFSTRDLALMKTVTDQVAAAIDRMRLIQALEHSRDELEERVQERTAELQKTNAALQQSNRDLEDFAHVASHDLQEPLRKIQTFADRLMTVHQSCLDDRTHDYLTRLQRAAGRMQDLVLDLLRYSRVASRPEPFTLFNLREAIEEAVLDLEVLREETGAQIEVDEMPDIEADRVQIRQLFQNLIGNALKYRSERQPLVRIRALTAVQAPMWEIRVEDNGIGFDTQYLDRIFKPFQRLHGKSSPYSGTGMGLAICRRIVERHGGSITAASRPGQGASFIVKLPKWDSRQENRQ